MDSRPLYYVAPKESLEFILKNGILTPEEVIKLIQSGELPHEVLGVSFGGKDSSNFRQFVSMVSNLNITKTVAQQICFARNGHYRDPFFMAIGYEISADIRRHPDFLDEAKVKQMNGDCYPSEILFKSKVPAEFIHPRYFAVRTF
jgi:hypothetical protein